MCSKWAAMEPSTVATVQSSSSRSVSLLPSVTIGSTARARPSTRVGPLPALAVVGDVGSHVHLGADAVAGVVLEDAVAALADGRAARRRDEMSPTRPPRRAAAMPRHSASSVTRISSRASGATSPIGTVIAASPCHPSTMAPQSIEMMSPSPQHPVPGDAVHDLVVDRGADRRREGRLAVALERRDAAVVADVATRRVASSSPVVTPGAAAARSSSSVRPTSSPATRILRDLGRRLDLQAPVGEHHRAQLRTGGRRRARRRCAG